MSNAKVEIRRVAWEANLRLSDALDDFDKAAAEVKAASESQSAAIIALAAIHGDPEVVRRGGVLRARDA